MATEPQESVWLFPPASSADENGLVAVGADITPSTLLTAYRNGLFPMPLQEEGIIGGRAEAGPRQGSPPVRRRHQEERGW